MTVLIKQPNFSSLIEIKNVDKISYMQDSNSFYIDFNQYTESRIVKHNELISVK